MTAKIDASSIRYFIDSLPIEQEGKPLLCLAFYVTLYFEDGHLQQKRLACAELFEEYIALCGRPPRWATDPERHRWVPFKAELSPRSWILEPTRRVWQYYYHWGGTFDECLPERVQAFGYPSSAPGGKLSFFNAALPATWFAENDLTDAPALVERWCRTLRPLHGSAGIGILTSPDTGQESRMAPHVRALARRFPGLEVDYPASHILYLQDGLKGVNWLTCLADRWVERLGGTTELCRSLGNDATLREYPGGVLIQAGPQPQIGDINRRIDAGSYRAVSRVLLPVRVAWHAPFRGFNEEDTRMWLTRFDGPAPTLNTAD